MLDEGDERTVAVFLVIVARGIMFKRGKRSSPQTGASLVEYALLVGFIATIGILAIRSLGQTMSQQFSSTSGFLSGQ